MNKENHLTDLIIKCAIEVHRTLGGPGLLESVYEECLVWELNKHNIKNKQQVLLPIRYKGHTISYPLRIDLFVEDMIIIECKAIAIYNSIFKSQLLTYLRLSGCKLGLVINFGQTLLKNGIHRVVNGL